ncbi:MAG: hypothetical protein GY866_12570, partial [Proteobacteria bacterium]|nr:hypothetical protein [Pseudomonadota bacterium]
MDEKTEQMLSHLRLKGLLEHWDRHIESARREDWSHVRLLKSIVDEEYNIKRENSRRLRLQRAKIPDRLVMETFPFDRQKKLSKRK